ncbi:MAG: LolA family protein [Deltaproteobacteria bacterium]
MKKISLLLLFTLSLQVLSAQKQYLSIKDSDSEAIKLFNRSKSVLKNATSLEILYKMTSYFPESKPLGIDGILKQQGNMYFVELGDKKIYCDSKSLIVFNRTQNTAQINDLDEKSGALTPYSILNSYDEKNYIFAIGEKTIINKKSLQQIVLKPAAKRSEYLKIEFIINTRSGLPEEIKMFMKDGYKTFFKISSVKLNQKFNNNVFIFNKAEHRGVTVDDLRMD